MKLVSIHVLFLGFFVLGCPAQELMEVIRLNETEAAKARVLAAAVRDAEARDIKARAEWSNTVARYQAAHPELPRPRFSKDYLVAFSSTEARHPVVEGIVYELKAAEQKEIGEAHQETVRAQKAIAEAIRSWMGFTNELVAARIPSTGGGTYAQLTDGRTVLIPEPWSSRVAFTKDFRIAMPRR